MGEGLLHHDIDTGQERHEELSMSKIMSDIAESMDTTGRAKLKATAATDPTAAAFLRAGESVALEEEYEAGRLRLVAINKRGEQGEQTRLRQLTINREGPAGLEEISYKSNELDIKVQVGDDDKQERVLSDIAPEDETYRQLVRDIDKLHHDGRGEQVQPQPVRWLK